ncbi:glutamyl-tRNA reductase [Nemorincola caseinilytica]|uniref:Glutamyl-tRNA reductase n=1 Tax=Nemorincola caseinilytica TaxID=2054315 RepID=A0ABP8N8K1_9BACT
MRVRHTTEEFIVTGINYKKSDAAVRGQFAVNNEQYAALLATACQFGISDMFVLSTCNRTEIYGFAERPERFAELICSVCTGSPDTFAEMAYTKAGSEAATHLYRVAAGLDSQILGDYEILGQIKNAVKQARAAGFIGQYMDRLLGSVLQASKAIKTHTALSGGTVSVSFAAIQYIREYAESRGADPAGLKIALVGTGKIGRVTCRNILDYLHTHNICLINRTEATAQALAAELGLRSAPLSALAAEAALADIVLVSTNATEPVITAPHLAGSGQKLIIDISVPCNVADDAQRLPGITFVDVDQLSRIKDETLQKRSAEVPKALAIINEHMAEFSAWCHMRRHAPVIKEMKSKLMGIPFISPVLLCDHQHTGQEEKVQKVLNDFAVNIRNGNTPGCYYIQAINDLIA